MILTPQQRKALEKALATVEAVEERVAFLEQIGSVSPVYKDRADAFRTRQQYLKQLATVAITADSSSR